MLRIPLNLLMQPLAKKVRTVISENCAYCHEPGSGDENAESALRDILDFDAILKAGVLQTIVSKAVNKQMPPPKEATMEDKDIALLKDWKEAGYPRWDRVKGENDRGFISPADIRSCIDKAYAMEFPNDPAQRSNIRYISFAHLMNTGEDGTGLTKEKRQKWVSALNKLINSLSNGNHIRRPVAIDPLDSIYRIDIRDYGWQDGKGLVNKDPKWPILANIYQAFAQPTDFRHGQYEGSHDILTVRGDWFIGAASQGTIYYQLLGITDNVKDLEIALGVDVEKNLAAGEAIRFGFNHSLVSESNRMIERHGTNNGGVYWKSYDFSGSSDDQNLSRKPMGPKSMPIWSAAGIDDSLQFQHDGGEMIFSLNNGLHGYALTDAQDKLLFANGTNDFGDKRSAGPTAIVVDKFRVKHSPRQANEVINAYSCMGCHYKGMKWEDSVIDSISVLRYSSLLGIDPKEFKVVPKEESQNDEYKKKLGLFRFINRIYADINDENVKDNTFRHDEKRYLTSLKQAMDSDIGDRPVFFSAISMEAPMSLDDMAAELGVTAAILAEYTSKPARDNTLLDFKTSVWQEISERKGEKFEFNPSKAQQPIMKRKEFYKDYQELIRNLWQGVELVEQKQAESAKAAVVKRQDDAKIAAELAASAERKKKLETLFKPDEQIFNDAIEHLGHYDYISILSKDLFFRNMSLEVRPAQGVDDFSLSFGNFLGKVVDSNIATKKVEDLKNGRFKVSVRIIRDFERRISSKVRRVCNCGIRGYSEELFEDWEYTDYRCESIEIANSCVNTLKNKDTWSDIEDVTDVMKIIVDSYDKFPQLRFKKIN